MSAPTTEELLVRIQSLEQQNRRALLSVLVPTVLLAVLIFVSCLPQEATVNGDIRAKSVTIVADDGRVLASLGPKDTISDTGPVDAGELVLRQGGKRFDEGYRIGMEAGSGLRVTYERSLDGQRAEAWGDAYVEINGLMGPNLALVGPASPRAKQPESESERGRVVISADGQQFIALHDEAGKQRAAVAIKGTKTDPEQKGVFLLFNSGAAASWAKR